MDKAIYKSKVSNLRATIKESNIEITKTELDYIEANKPCEIGDTVEIILGSDRKAIGEVLSFGILKDATVCITSYKKGARTKYITTPHKEVSIL